ncbi:MAG: DUF948 domain-containing protein [Propioniciclava sp.]
MTVGEIAGLIAAVAFVFLVGMTAVPLYKLGRVLDEMSAAVKDFGTGTTPILTELKETVEVTNEEIARLGGVTQEVEKVTSDVARVTRQASTLVENTAAVSRVVTAAVGRPLVGVAASAHAVRAAIAAKREQHNR